MLLVLTNLAALLAILHLEPTVHFTFGKGKSPSTTFSAAASSAAEEASVSSVSAAVVSDSTNSMNDTSTAA